MNYIVICDYPYHTIKRFFLEESAAFQFNPPHYMVIKEWYKLNHRIYSIVDYKEVERDGKITKSYSINKQING